MKKALKFLGYILGVIIIVIFAIVIYINSALPNVELKDDYKAELTEQNINRGEYLVNSVTACFHCHSTVDFNKFSGEIVEADLGKGGRYYPEEGGFPGTFYSSNITPYTMSNWTDAEIYRAITSGVNKDGDALFPLMPYYTYKYLTDQDAKSIIAYLRTIDPIEASYEKASFTFPFSVILKTIPNEPEPTDPKTITSSVSRGEYLINIAGCESCHSTSAEGEKIESMRFAGGFEIPMETGGTCKAANITPDNETGIGSWSKQKFIDRFKFYENNDSLIVNHGEFNSEMPWVVYSKMTLEDLGAIYDFLRTVKPVKNNIIKYTP